MSVSAVIPTPIEPVPLSALQTPMTVSRDTQASSQVSAGTPGSCMALQEGHVTRTVRPLRPEGRAAAWRPGQDVVLSGHEASSHYRCPFHVTLCGKTLRAGTYGRLSPRLGQAERSWALRHSMAQLAASPSVQGPDACVPGTHLGNPRSTWARCSGRAVVPGHILGTRLQCAHLALGTHKHRSIYLIKY